MDVTDASIEVTSKHAYVHFEYMLFKFVLSVFKYLQIETMKCPDVIQIAKMSANNVNYQYFIVGVALMPYHNK